MKELLTFSLVCILSSHAWTQQYQVSTIGFYNLENLFDTIDQETVEDMEFTPRGSKVWNIQKYHQKLENMSHVISEIGTDTDIDGVDILGVAEIENLGVLLDLTNMPKIKDRHYQMIHGDSKDARGIDVALLFNPQYFLPDSFDLLEVAIYNDDGSRYFTRDVLYVFGKFKGTAYHIFVNHWPSRRGGEVASSPNREKAARVVRAKCDEIFSHDSHARIVIMGDFNDNPTNKSIAHILGAKKKLREVREKDLYNTHANYFQRGIGSNAYRDTWHLFDQIIISEDFLLETKGTYFYKGSAIFRKDYLIQKTGNFKGYPYRTFAGDNFISGYSDHFPTYIQLVKKIE